MQPLTAIEPGSPVVGSGAETASVFIAAGEASGDWVGARLAEALRSQLPNIILRGLGGKQMASAGVELLADSSTWGAIGFCESLAKVPRLWRAFRSTLAHLRSSPPAALVLIDFGAMNIRLSRALRATGLRTLYYLPPGSWRRR